MTLEFPHRQAAHCESGVTSNLLRSGGFEISEALAFGVGSGLFFAYMPFVKVGNLPLTTYRTFPGGIFKRVASRLGIRVKTHRFRDEGRGMRALDDLLSRGIPVGAQVGVFWLPFFPPALRFHFNAHNLVIYGRQADQYLISDPVLETTVTCGREDLVKARFARGPLAPRGRLYYCLNSPDPARLEAACRRGIREVCNRMLKIPMPFFGVRGIRYLARSLVKWPRTLGDETARRYLGQVIRMQEEIGTGGAGFRFMYAAFLQEASGLLGRDSLAGLSERLTQVGDLWREFALVGARHCKERTSADETYPACRDILMDCADREQQIFTELRAEAS